MILKQLSLESFSSFREEQVLELPATGLFRIQGRNHDTKGDSGSGKSSIFQALALLLGYNTQPATSLQNWDSDKPLKVRGKFTVQAGELVVGRDGSKLSLTLNGAKLTGGASHLNEQLQKLIGVDPKLLGELTYRRQRSRGFFLSMPDSDKKEFLGRLLRLEPYESKIESLTAEIKKLSDLLVGQSSRVATLKASVPAVPDLYQLDTTELVASIERVGLDLSTQTGRIEAIQRELEEAVLKQNEARDSVKLDVEYDRNIKQIVKLEGQAPHSGIGLVDPKIQVLEERLAMVVSKRNQVEAERQVKAQQLTDLRASLAERNIKLAKIEALKKAIAECGEDRCPTCSQTWPGAELHSKTLGEQLASLTQQVEATATIADEAEKLAMDLKSNPVADLTAVIDKLKDSIRAAMAEDERSSRAKDQERLDAIRTLKERNSFIKQHYQNAVLSAERNAAFRVQSLRHDLDQANATVKILRSQMGADKKRLSDTIASNETLKRQHDKAVAQNAQALSLVQQEEGKLADLEVQLTLKKDAQQALKTFLALIFEEVLAEIASETNDSLVSIPNVQHVTVDFSTERETQSGTLKKEISLVIRANGTAVPFESLSGGQQASIELVVDRAVAQVASRRIGVSFGWLILDEAFDGMDDVVKESCLEILKTMSRDTLVLVVDHSSQFKELFDGFIQVEHRDGVSRVVRV